MSRHQRRFDDADFDLGGRSRSGGMGSLVLATAIGIGIGMLAAPDAGPRTRRRLRTRLAALGEDLGDGLEEIQERGFGVVYVYDNADMEDPSEPARYREDRGSADGEDDDDYYDDREDDR